MKIGLDGELSECLGIPLLIKMLAHQHDMSGRLLRHDTVVSSLYGQLPLRRGFPPLKVRTIQHLEVRSLCRKFTVAISKVTAPA